MPIIYLSPSTQENNLYVNGGTEEEWMNRLADALVPCVAMFACCAGVALAFLSYRKSVQTAIYIAVPLMALASALASNSVLGVASLCERMRTSSGALKRAAQRATHCQCWLWLGCITAMRGCQGLGFLQVGLQGWQGLGCEGLQFSILTVLGVFLKQLDGRFVRLDLVIGVRLIERLGSAQFKDHRLGLVDQVSLGRNLDILAGGQRPELLVGGAVVLNHHVRERFDVTGGALFLGQFASFDFGNAFGRGILDKVVGILGRMHGASQSEGQCKGPGTQASIHHETFLIEGIPETLRLPLSVLSHVGRQRFSFFHTDLPNALNPRSPLPLE